MRTQARHLLTLQSVCRRPTAAWTAGLVVAGIGVLRLAAALRLHGPLLMPDEYLYTAIARSVAHGGWPTVRGGPFDFIPVLAPILVAPAWLIHDVGLAYRVAQSEGVVAMSLAAIPAFKLSRRVGLGERAAAAAAIFAVLVPDLGYDGSMLSEPYAYPLFLATVLLAVDAIATPSARRQVWFLVASGLLCLTRLQFFYLPGIYIVAAAVASRPFGFRSLLRAHRIVFGAIGLAAAGLAVVGPAVAVGRYSGLKTFQHAPAALVQWSFANLLLLLVAAGWVTVPGAAVGLARQFRDGGTAPRAFAVLTAMLVVSLVGEAGVFGAGLGQLEERYTFYAAPLLIIAFLAAIDGRAIATRGHAVAAGVLAVTSLFLPLDSTLFDGMPDQAPVMMAFLFVQQHVGWVAPLVAGAILLSLAVACLALGRRGSSLRVAALGALTLAVVSVGFTSVLAPLTRGQAESSWALPRAPHSPQGSFLAFGEDSPSGDLETGLFWNPWITHVVVVGSKPVDGFPSTLVHLAGGGRLVGARGAIEGPVVFQRGIGSISLTGSPIAHGDRLAVIDDAGHARLSALVVGLFDSSKVLAPNGEIDIAAAHPGEQVEQTVRLRLHNPVPGTSVLRFRCAHGFSRLVSVDAGSREVLLPFAGTGVASCHFSFVSGVVHFARGRAETVEAQGLPGTEGF